LGLFTKFVGGELSFPASPAGAVGAVGASVGALSGIAAALAGGRELVLIEAELVSNFVKQLVVEWIPC
jgi:hypothetical protein